CLGLGDERRPGLDRHIVGADAEPLGLAPGLAGADVVLPAVPGAREDLALAREAHLARHGRLDRAPQLPLAQRAALVGAAVTARRPRSAPAWTGRPGGGSSCAARSTRPSR